MFKFPKRFPCLLPGRIGRCLTKFTVIAMIAPCQAASAAAVEKVAQLPEVVVSASRIPLPAQEVGSAVTVITAEDIERKQGVCQINSGA